MANSATYQYNFNLVDFNPATGTYTSAEWMPDSGPNVITDDESGNASLGNGVEAADEVLWYNKDTGGAATTITYTGFMVDGAPIIKFNALGQISYYLLTDEGPVGVDKPGGTATASSYTYCFARGTHIATPDGERKVEDLVIGDSVLDHQGRAVPVKWIGRQTHKALMAKLQGQLPVRIEAGALGDGVPRRDLFVTPDHALLVDGVLVHALALVNGRTITQVHQWDRDVEYFHIETEAHEIIMAEGAPAETFIDNVDRAQFDNHAEFLALYPDAKPMVELPLPRVKFARQLPMAIKRRLDAIAAKTEVSAA